MFRRPAKRLSPGIAHGVYPQRDEPRYGWFERASGRVIRCFKRGVYRSSRSEGVVALINAHGKSLSGMSDARLGEMVDELRVLLRGKGLSEELSARAFALVRELADRTMGMRHFDVQVLGGWVMLNGMLAEMQTGEGKTLTATLPACTAALAGIPVHVISVNDYLVTRDASLMQPLYEALGLSVGTITEDMDAQERRAAYACDITYCTGKQLVFDYLKDRLVLGNTAGRLHLGLEKLYRDEARVDRLLLRGLCFAIVDEADSVLIDEARTPLILAKAGDTKEQQRIFTEALELAGRLLEGDDFLMDAREREVRLTDRGESRLGELAEPLGGLWTGPRRRVELVKQALTARYLFQRDRHYLVQDGKVEIIDEYTGRVMADRSWSQGLHQMIETKEGCEITAQRETLARISYQRFFRRYLRLSGMSGTAQEVAPELWSTYHLHVVTIPTHRPPQRSAYPTRIHPNVDAKWSAVVASVNEVHAKGRPVLVGTRSVADSEHLSALLQSAGLLHQVLNARQDVEEAAIVERAGEPGRITVATNMAGRGTDIRLTAEVVGLGGLHVIATERNEARRIDRQLFGRCGRQGDPGSFEAILSLEDELVRHYCPRLVSRFITNAGASRRLVARWAGDHVTSLTQRIAERRHARMRRELLKMDERLSSMLAFSGRSD